MGGFVPNYTQKQDDFQKHIDLMVKAMRSGQERRYRSVSFGSPRLGDHFFTKKSNIFTPAMFL